jgi:hypothetical protein
MSGAYFPSHSAAVLRRLIDAADFADRIGPVRDAGFPAASIA